MNEQAQFVEWGAALMAYPGQSASGDGYLALPLPGGLFVAVVDGLGHGHKAADAAQAALEALRQHASPDLMAVAQQAHQALVGTRGAVMSLAFISPTGAMQWLSVGNVAGLLARADRDSAPARQHLMLRGGVVGYRMPPLRAFAEQLKPGDTLIFTSDGIRSAFAEALPLHLPPQALAEAVMASHNRQTDDACVVAVRFIG